MLADCDVVIDVGGVYDPATARYDHHQRGFGEVFGHGFDTKLSSAGARGSGTRPPQQQQPPRSKQQGRIACQPAAICAVTCAPCTCCPAPCAGHLRPPPPLLPPGLVYKHHGPDIVASLMKLPTEHGDVQAVLLQVYKSFIEAVDAVDNGVNQYDTDKPAR